MTPIETFVVCLAVVVFGAGWIALATRVGSWLAYEGRKMDEVSVPSLASGIASIVAERTVPKNWSHGFSFTFTDDGLSGMLYTVAFPGVNDKPDCTIGTVCLCHNCRRKQSLPEILDKVRETVGNVWAEAERKSAASEIVFKMSPYPPPRDVRAN